MSEALDRQTSEIVARAIKAAYDPAQVVEVKLVGGSLEDGVHIAKGKARLRPKGFAGVQTVPFKLDFDPTIDVVTLAKDLGGGSASDRMILKEPWDPPDRQL